MTKIHINPTIEQLKREAKRMVKAPSVPDLTHTQALNILAKRHGHKDWQTLVMNRTGVAA